MRGIIDSVSDVATKSTAGRNSLALFHLSAAYYSSGINTLLESTCQFWTTKEKKVEEKLCSQQIDE